MSRRRNKGNAVRATQPRKTEVRLARAAGVDLLDVPPRNRAERRARHFSAARWYRVNYWGKGRRLIRGPKEGE